LVWNQIALVNMPGCFNARRGSGTHRNTQKITSTNMLSFKLLAKKLGLSALAAARWPEKN
jgi:hypothetical protein